MELTFLTAELRDICEDRAVAIERYGPVVGMELDARLADIDAVETLEELASLHPDDLTDVGDDAVQLRISDNTRLALAPGGVKPPRHGDGRLDWSLLDRLCVTGVETDHG